MATTPLEKIVILDYSGTLSLDASLFARADHLVRMLHETGLDALGVSTPELFWNEIVNPTWIEGSTTTAGYNKVMTERIEALGLAPGASHTVIAAAVCQFVDRYLRHSSIDPHWRPVLQRLSEHPSALTIVATDHYREATQTIILRLKSWGIASAKAGACGEPGHRPTAGKAESDAYFCPPVVIANSADLGFWKADRRFWTSLIAPIPLETVRRILLIDDFGFNEEKGDRYSDRRKVLTRRKRTVAVLTDSFRIKPEVFSFFLEANLREQEEARARLIAEIGARIGKFLASRETLPSC